MTELAEPRHNGEGVFPRTGIFFDCQACHHTTSKLRWQKRGSTGLGPGLPHFNDANAVMLRTIAERVSPEMAHRLEADTRTLHLALSAGIGHPGAIAPRIAGEAQQMAEMLSDHDFTQADMRAIIVALSQMAQTSDISDYAAAEQTTMAFASIIYSLKMNNDLDAAQYARLRGALEGCYAATRNEDDYKPASFAAAAQAIETATPTW